MTRKDYILIANALAETRPSDKLAYMAERIQWRNTAVTIADALSQENERFDYQRFLEWAQTKEVA